VVGPGEGILFNTVSRVEDCMEVNNANYDLGMTGDLNMTEHLNQTTKPSLLVNKPREDEEHNEIFRETAEGEKGAVIEEIEDDTDTDGHGE
jgi:hypothetical protein